MHYLVIVKSKAPIHYSIKYIPVGLIRYLVNPHQGPQINLTACDTQDLILGYLSF